MWSLTIHLVAVIFICISNLHVCVGLQCLECKDLPNPDTCRVVTTCSGDSRCFVEQFVSSGGLVLYNLGCMSPARCKSMNKRQDTLSTTDVVTCVECCDGDMCNLAGCGAKAVAPSQRPPICFACESQQDPMSCRDVAACDNNNICGIYMTSSVSNGNLWKSHCLPLNQCQSLKNSGNICVHCCTQDFCNNYCNESHTNETQITTVQPQPSTTTPNSVITQTTARELTQAASTNNYQTPSSSSDPKSTTLVTSTISRLSSSSHVVSAISTTAKPATTTSDGHPLTSKLPHATSPVSTVLGCRTKPVDLCFIFHASGGDVGHHTFTREKQFAVEIVNSLFSNDLQDLRICAIDFATDSHTVIHMDHFQTLADADNAIYGIPYRLGRPNSHIALSNLNQEYTFHERPSAEKIAVFMTDVTSTHVNETLHQAHQNTRHGIELYAVGVGVHNRHELQKATPQHYFVPNADQLNLAHVQLQQAICHSISIRQTSPVLEQAFERTEQTSFKMTSLVIKFLQIFSITVIINVIGVFHVSFYKFSFWLSI